MENTPSSPLLDLMRSHRSVRSFKPDPLSTAWIEAIVETAQWASSSSFKQVYSVIAVRAPELKSQLRPLCGGQECIEQCPVFLVFCADLNRMDDICKARGRRANLERMDTFLAAVLDVGLLMQNAALAAEALGLGIVMIGGLRNNPRDVVQLLGLPHGVIGISGMCVGFPAETPVQRPRLPLDEVLHWDCYNSAGREDRLQAYDDQIREAGIYQPKNGETGGWTDVMARISSVPPQMEGRLHLRDVLEEQGFELK